MFSSMLADVEIPDATLPGYLFDGLTAQERLRTALVDLTAATTLTYGELADRVDGFADELIALGVRPNDVVAQLSPNGAAGVIAFHGVLRTGATVTPLSALSTHEDIARQLRAAGAAWMVTVPGLLAQAQAAAAECGIDAARIVAVDASAGTRRTVGAERSATEVRIDPRTHVAVLPFSSGTTGAPKGVMLTHRNLVACIEQMRESLGMTAEDIAFAPVPFFHIYGLNVALNLSLRARACIVTTERFQLEPALAGIQAHRCTYVFAAPPIVLALARSEAVDRYDLSSLRQIISGAAPLDGDTAAAVTRRLGARVTQGYGMTEASPSILSTPISRPDIPLDSVGVLLPNQQARLVDPATGDDVAQSGPMSAPGELWVRGPQIMSGYLGDLASTDATVDADGFLHTGDVMTRHEDGWFVVVDRIKELIKYNGYQVSPVELETIVRTHPALADAAVVGVLNDDHQEIPVAFVVAGPGERPSEDEIIAFVAERVAPHKKVRRVRYVDAIPRSPAGKILRRELRDGGAHTQAAAAPVRFPHLLSPVTVGRLTLPNRVLMGSMHLGLEEEPDGFERMAVFYAERARGGVGLIVTGGITPTPEGGGGEPAAVMRDEGDVADHRLVTEAVHEAGGRIVMQLLHTGRYAKREDAVAPSALAAPISRGVPREMTDADIRRTIAAYGRAAALAIEAGYDGVDIMGSEGYLISQFLAPATNHRDDEWGGDPQRRRAFALAVVRAVREAMGPEPLLSFRISLVDLVPDGNTLAETLTLARELEAAGVDLLVTGIGWHESRIPTIATPVPRAAFVDYTRELRRHVSIPVVASNRINAPETAEEILAAGDADLISMARPLLADPEFVVKARDGDRAINLCIACNQACIDHALTGRVTSCLVNPRACHETVLTLGPTRRARRIAVVGGGPAGMSAARSAAERGHRVTLFEERDHLGGQFDLARRVPGKEEFAGSLEYFAGEVRRLGVSVRTGVRADAAALADFDEVIIATGVVPRRPDIPGVEEDIVADYAQILRGERVAGERVVILGAGGIGFDMAEFLTQEGESLALDNERFRSAWGLTTDPLVRGGVTAPVLEPVARQVTMLQRKTSKPGAGLGPTTGWIHRTEVSRRGVRALSGVEYVRITRDGVDIRVDGEERSLSADTVVLCSGQESERALADELLAAGVAVHIVGGARLAGELDAKRAIREGMEAAARV